MNTIIYVGEHPQTFEVNWHSHAYWELVFCTGGEGVFTLKSGVTLHYSDGELVAIPPNEVHMNNSTGGFTNIHVTLSEPAFPYKKEFIVRDDAEGHMRIAFQQTKFYYSSDIKRRDLVLSALGDLIISYIIVYNDNRVFSAPVEKIRNEIIQHFAEPNFELDQAIKSMPFNYDYLRKMFQKEMGITPLKYMTDLRMKKAVSMLTVVMTRGSTMSEIASCCGFSDPLYFSRVFKKYHGCSPSEFSRRKKAEMDLSGIRTEQ